MCVVLWDHFRVKNVLAARLISMLTWFCCLFLCVAVCQQALCELDRDAARRIHSLKTPVPERQLVIAHLLEAERTLYAMHEEN